MLASRAAEEDGVLLGEMVQALGAAGADCDAVCGSLLCRVARAFASHFCAAASLRLSRDVLRTSGGSACGTVLSWRHVKLPMAPSLSPEVEREKGDAKSWTTVDSLAAAQFPLSVLGLLTHR